MRTQIIHFDEYDDLLSVRDRLMRVRLPQVFIIIPNSGSILINPHDLLLLNRLAIRLGITLVIISTRKDIISQCDDFKIFHFPSIKEAKNTTWPSPNPIENSYLKRSRGMLYEAGIYFGKRVSPKKASICQKAGLISAVIISFSAVVLVISPSATILIHPDKIVQRTSLKFIASSGVDDSVRSEYVPPHTVTRLISESIVTTTSGSEIVPDENASGIVRFENLTEEVVSVPLGTVVMTTSEPPIRYLTTEDGIISPGVGEYALVDVQAAQAGQEGNIGRNEVKIVEGVLGSMVLVTNPGSIQGGTEKRVAAASDEDRMSAERNLSKKIQNKCATEISTAVPVGDIFLGSSTSFEVLASESYPKESQPSGFFSLSMDVSCLGWYARREDILSRATLILDKEMPGGYQAADEVVIIGISTITRSEENFRWETTVERSLTASIDRENLVLMILGKNQSTALILIEEQFCLKEKPHITMFPSWWPLMPLIASQIQVEITE